MRAPSSSDRARSRPATVALLAGRRDGTTAPAGGPSLAPTKNVRLGLTPTMNFQLAWRTAPVCSAVAHPGLGAGTRH
jgi:hypothetical protein